jgi:hypothetical protein
MHFGVCKHHYTHHILLNMCMSVFDGEYLETIWVMFQGGFEGTNFSCPCGSYSSKVELGCLLPAVPDLKHSRWQVSMSSQTCDFKIWPFQASLHYPSLNFWKIPSMVRKWKKNIKNAIPLETGFGPCGTEVNQTYNGWTFEAFLGFVRMAEDEACHQDLLDEETAHRSLVFYVFFFIWLVLWNMAGLFSHHIGNVISPTDFNSIIFQRGRLKPPTRYCMTLYDCMDFKKKSEGFFRRAQHGPGSNPDCMAV